MNRDADDSRWMDERDPKVQPCPKCDVELTIESGNTCRDREIAETARALRAPAVHIDSGKLDTGFHPIRMLSGAEIGEVYLDHEVVRDA